VRGRLKRRKIANVRFAEAPPVSADLKPPYAIVDAFDRLDDVRRLFRDYAEWIGVDLGFQDFEQELATLPGKYAPPDGRLLLLVRGAEAVGCIALRRFDKTSGEEKRLYVRPAERGRGLGKALAGAIVEAARTIGYRRLMLDTLEPMVEARELYRSFGFTEIPAYYSNPLPGAIYMELKL
jgi:GNAT superfamily N-acetyltransferase